MAICSKQYLVFFLSMFAMILILQNPAVAQQKTVLIVAMDTSEKGGVTEKLYKDVVAIISEHIRQAGFLTTEPAVGNIGADESSDRQLLADLQQQNKTKQPPAQISFVAFVEILADMVLLEDGAKINVDIRGRMLNVADGAVLARFDLPVPGDLIAPANCDRDCVVELLQANTAFIAKSLGHVLGQRLKNGNDIYN